MMEGSDLGRQLRSRPSGERDLVEDNEGSFETCVGGCCIFHHVAFMGDPDSAGLAAPALTIIPPSGNKTYHLEI